MIVVMAVCEKTADKSDEINNVQHNFIFLLFNVLKILPIAYRNFVILDQSFTHREAQAIHAYVSVGAVLADSIRIADYLPFHNLIISLPVVTRRRLLFRT